MEIFRMATNWNFEETKFINLPDGDYRIKINSIEKKISQAGNDMWEIKFAPSGINGKLIYYYLVFNPDHRDITNKNLTSFYNSFNIPYEKNKLNENLQSFVGKIGAANIYTPKDDNYGFEKIKYFITDDRLKTLPPYVNKLSNQAVVSNADDEIPF